MWVIMCLCSALARGEYACSDCLPSTFDFLSNVVPSILQDIRYYTAHNFVGRRIEGYNSPSCLLTKSSINNLRRVQEKALVLGYTLKVYDCYRPQRAVNDFVNWANNTLDILTKTEFYPTLDKSTDLFPEYIATKSGHSRGSTIDLTLVRLPAKEQELYLPGQELVPCFENTEKRFRDNSIDMGTGFDCFSKLAHTNATEYIRYFTHTSL